MSTNAKILSIIDFATAFIKEHGSDEMLKSWESKKVKEELKTLMSSGKKIKDPNAPKGALSAYMFFCKDQRSAVKNDIGDNSKEIVQELGRRWNILKDCHSEGLEKKQWEKYEKQALDDKTRFEAEMASYEPPTHSQMEQIKEAIVKKKRKSGSKSDKDENENTPKAAKSAYIFFTLEERVKIKEEYPEMSGKEIMAEMGVRWKDLKSDKKRKEEMNKYAQLALKDKERYDNEMANFKDEEKIPSKKKDKNDDLFGSDTEVDSEVKEEPKIVKKSKKQSNYVNFCTKVRPEVKKENPELKGMEVTKKLKEMWADLSQEEKDAY